MPSAAPSILHPLRPQFTISQDYVHLSNRLPVRVEFAPAHLAYPPHDHEFYELCLVTQGRARHLTSMGSEPLERGSVIVVAPGQVHGFADAEDYGLVNVYYLAEWFLADLQALRDIDRLVPLFFQKALFPQRDAGGVAHFSLEPNELDACLGDLSDLEKESVRARPQPLFLQGCLVKCLVRVARAYGRSLATSTGDDEFTSPVAGALRQIERAVSLGESLDVTSLARKEGMSVQHFGRLFKAATGMSAGTYFQRRRIHRACHRLLTTGATATEIAYALGYADSAHFSRLFKETTGLSPRDYRKKFAAM